MSAQGLAEVKKSQGPIPFGMMRRGDGLIDSPEIEQGRGKRRMGRSLTGLLDTGRNYIPTEFYQLDNPGEM